VKVVAGEDSEVLEQLAALYGEMTTGGVFRAASIKTAEAAKVIENAQRDINIAFMNEVAQIFGKIDLSIWDVLAAARTKWNFLPFEPGLVGGHCIGVDPYYLSHLAQSVGLHPQVVLAGRTTNDGMGAEIADRLHERRKGRAGRALVMGLTFKENVPDLRNSRVADIVARLDALGYDVALSDPIANAEEAKRLYGRAPIAMNGEAYDLVIGAVAHDQYRVFDDAQLAGLVATDGTLADLKGIWRDRDLSPAIDRWTL
jgi:UDP-N-acetyl-D-galactosamine dehydrogenase